MGLRSAKQLNRMLATWAGSVGRRLGPQLPNPGSEEGTGRGIRTADSGLGVLQEDVAPATLMGERSKIQGTCVFSVRSISLEVPDFQTPSV